MKCAPLVATLAFAVLANPARPDPVISADARIVTFTDESNLKVFRYDRDSHEMTRLDICADGAEFLDPWLTDATMTPDARFTVYTHDNTIDGKPYLCLRDENTSHTEVIAGFLAFNPSLSADGRFLAYTQSNFEFIEVLLLDRLTDTTTPVCLDSAGNPGESTFEDGSEIVPFCDSPAISADGRFIAFISQARNFAPNDTNGVYDTFVRDLSSGITRRVSQSTQGVPANAQSGSGTAISADGRYVAFESLASNLVAADTNGVYDIFVHDRKKGTTWRASVSSQGAQANGASFDPQFSQDGKFIVFRSAASNLVRNDTNGADDIFVHNLRNGKTERISVSSGSEQANGASEGGALSAHGRYVVFRSAATNLVPDSGEPGSGIYVRDRLRGITEAIPLPPAP